jgi:hypothetical protein
VGEKIKSKISLETRRFFINLTVFLVQRIIELMTKKKTTIEDLAGMVKRGFDGVDKRFEQVDKRFDGVDADIKFLKGEVAHLNANMTTVQRDVAEIRKQFVRRDEFDDLFGRVAYLERRFGIKSGK